MILYKNGSKDVFNETPAAPAPAQQATTPAPVAPAPKPAPAPVTPAPAPVPAQAVAPPPAPAQPYYGTPQRESKLILMFTAGTHAPVGVLVGLLNEKSIGFYVAGRVHPREIGTISTYEINNRSINDDFWVYHYSGVSDYTRWSGTGGITFGFTKNFYVYGGLGAGGANYKHAYWQYGRSGNYYGVEWIKDGDFSTPLGLESETGIMLNFGAFCLQTGVSTLNFGDFMVTGGLGVAF